MPANQSPLRRFARELNRRKVTQTAAVYAVAGLAAIEFADITFAVFEISVGWERALITLVLAGFPVSLVLAWLLEFGPTGVRLRPSSRMGRRKALVVGGLGTVVALAVAGAIFLPTGEESGDERVAADRPRIEVFQPEVWSAGDGVLEVQPQRSVMIHGLARYAAGLTQILIDGRRMSVGFSDDKRIASFTGFVDDADEDGEIEIVALAGDGRYASRRFRVAVSQATTVEEPVMAAHGVGTERMRWAIVIGISDYADESVRDLRYADDDALAFYEFLTSPRAGMGGLPEDHIRLLVNEDATAGNIRSAFTTFLQRSGPQDVVTVFIAGHGSPDPQRPEDLYLLGHDTELADLAATGVAVRTIQEAISSATAYNKVLITDASDAGAGRGAPVAVQAPVDEDTGMAAGPVPAVAPNVINTAFADYINASSGGFAVFTASQADQLSREGEEYGGGHGVFAHYLLRGLEGRADYDGDRIVNLGEMMEYTRNMVRRSTGNTQIPTISLTSFDRFWPMALVLGEGPPE